MLSRHVSESAKSGLDRYYNPVINMLEHKRCISSTAKTSRLTFRSLNNKDHTNDLALIRLRRKGDGSGLKFNDYVTPASVQTQQIPDKDGKRNW